MDARQACGCVPRRAHLSIGLLLFLPLPVCASLLSAIGNTHRSQVLSDLLTRCWNPNSRNLYCLHTLEPQLPLYSTFFRPATNHRLNFLFTVHFSFNLRQYPPTPTAVFFPNISITMQYAPQQHTYTLVLRSIHLATTLYRKAAARTHRKTRSKTTPPPPGTGGSPS